MVDDVNVGALPDEMQNYVKTRTYIDPKDMDMFRKKLLYATPQTPNKVYEIKQVDDYNPDVPPLLKIMFKYREQTL